MTDLSDKFLVKTLLLVLFMYSGLAFAQDCADCGRRDLSLFWPLRYLQEWPLQLIEVEKVDYEKNEKAMYCKRPPEMVDTIVIHHSEGGPDTTPQHINEMHLNRGTPDDPWYMIAYSFVVNSPYPGSSEPRARVTEGRPMDLVGAHAGTNAFVTMDKEQQQMWDEGKVTCGKTGEEFKVNSDLIKKGKIKANVTTIGLVVVGNYAPFSRNNPNGYSPRKPRKPTKQTLDMIARMSCQLQKKYPKITNIKWHSMYHPTTCPGNLKDSVGEIKTMARRFGCEFK